jgi:hypothetical protein
MTCCRSCIQIVKNAPSLRVVVQRRVGGGTPITVYEPLSWPLRITADAVLMGKPLPDRHFPLQVTPNVSVNSWWSPPPGRIQCEVFRPPEAMDWVMLPTHCPQRQDGHYGSHPIIMPRRRATS